MNWSLRKQIMYFSVIAGFFIVVIGLIVWRQIATRPETCFDGVQNQDERGPDCGGVCDLVCRQDARPLVNSWRRALPITDTVYNVTTLVENTNVAAGVREAAYTFKLYDAANILIAERSGSVVIPPKQEIAIFESGVSVGNRVPVLVDFEFDQSLTWEDTEERFARQNIVTQSTQWDRMETTPTLRAQLQNTSLFSYDDVRIVLVAYDRNGNALAASQTIIDRIDQGSTASAVFTWPQPFDGVVARQQLYVHIDPFTQGRR